MQIMVKDRKQKGVSLIITFFMMMIVLVIVLSVSIILYSEVKIIRNIGGSVLSFYAADSGIEKVLYYDRQVKPSGVSRGLCSMLSATVNSAPNSKYCSTATTAADDPNGTKCSNITKVGTCDPITCNNCTITFDTNITGGDDKVRKYSVTTSITESPSYLFDIQSAGNFNSISRKVEIYNTSRY